MINLPLSIPTIETSQLILREIKEEDSENYFRICAQEIVMEAYGVPAHKNIGDTLNLMAYLDNQFQLKQMMRWGICLKNCPNELIGDVGFWRFVHVRKRAEVGAKVDQRHWRKGVASEALSAVINYGFDMLGINSYEGNTFLNNVNSARMIEKIGFVKEGHIKDHSFNVTTGKFEDTYLYSLTRNTNIVTNYTVINN